MYQALYRKWRPKTFDDVVGQEHISETLKNQIASGRLSHAYLFVGTRGTGKTTCAKILARAVNCTDPQNGNPCNRCPSCLGIDNGSIMDVMEMDAASNNGVDNVRALREEAVFTPVDVKKRVYIIDEVHMLSTAAFNALLKILEEPPEHLIFILATTEIHKVPATILSRCQRFTFKRGLPPMIAERLLRIAGQEGFTLTDDAASLLARLADGSFRDALSLLDQCASGEVVDAARVLSAIGLAENDEIVRLLQAVADRDISSALEVLDKLYLAGKLMSSVIESLTALVRDLLVASLMPGGGTVLLSGSYEPAVLEDFRKRFKTSELLAFLDILRETMQDKSGAKLNAELCLLRLCTQNQNADQSSLAARLDALEDRLDRGPVNAPTAFRETAAPKEKVVRIPESPPVQVPEAAFAEPVPPKSEPSQAEAANQQPSPAALPGDIWNSILEQASKDIDPGAYAFLTDPSQASALIDGSVVTIRTKGGFMANIISGAAVTSALKDAAEDVLKAPASIRVIQDDGNTNGGNTSINKLKNFSNVKFE
jgi:DNA polymerase-3 subunit gamma/tau